MQTDDTQSATAPDPGAEQRRPPSPLAVLVRVLVVLLILAASLGVSWYWLTNRPRARRRPPAPKAVLVEARPVRARSHPVAVEAMGTVVPARTVHLGARVGGEIVELSPQLVPGGRFRAGELVARLDPEDYQLAVRQRTAELDRADAEIAQRQAAVDQRTADVARADSALALEMGQQAVAKREYELLGRDLPEQDRALVLRRPQLRTAQAEVKSAEAALEAARSATKAAAAAKATAQAALDQARLNLRRTTVRAPFNASVQSENVDPGSQVQAGVGLATLTGTDAYWVEVSVPVGQLRPIRVPGLNADAGSAVRVYYEAAWGKGAWREGRVVRALPDLEPRGRMARLIVSVPDPLDLAKPPAERRPLILGAFVRVDIEGRALANAVRVPRSALRDGRKVWLLRPDRTLGIREVEVAWSADDAVYVSEGLDDGDMLITSDLGAPVEGMALRTRDMAATRAAATRGAATRRGAGPGSRKGAGR